MIKLIESCERITKMFYKKCRNIALIILGIPLFVT